MLPKDLLPVISKQGTIRPKYAFPNPGSLSMLDDLIQLFKSARGSKRGELDGLLKGLETGLDYKMVRGVATLLFRRCEFGSSPPLDPIAVRRAVFRRASEAGVTTREERDRVISGCAKEMGRRPEEVEESLWADMEEEQSMVSFKDIDARDLLRMYNLSLVQTLLFKARSMEIAVPEGCIGLVSTAKRLGLMYRVERRGDGFLLSIDGPLSALRLCERYGNLMARLVPEMVRLPRWEMWAHIAWRGEKPSLFELSSSRDGDLIAYRELDGGGTDEGVADRAKMLSKLRGSLKGWTVEEVASPVTVEGLTFLPDLKASKDGQMLYLELLGFWTEDFLRKRPGASRHGGYFAFAERSMACSGASKGAGVILYDKRTLVKEVVSAVQRYAGSHAPATRVENGPADGPMPITGDLLDLKALARSHGTDEETLFRSLEPRGYIRLREVLVSRRMAERIASEVMGMANYLDASAHIRNSGIPYPDDLLRELGFTVVWHGLDPQRAELRFVG